MDKTFEQLLNEAIATTAKKQKQISALLSSQVVNKWMNLLKDKNKVEEVRSEMNTYLHEVAKCFETQEEVEDAKRYITRAVEKVNKEEK